MNRHFYPNSVFQFLDGKLHVYQGISGRFHHTVSFHKYLNRYEEKLHFIPDEQGRESHEYLKVKRELGDDWDFDLTDNIEAYTAIAVELDKTMETGFDFDKALESLSQN